MDEKDKKINLPAPDAISVPKIIKIGDSEFQINPPGSVVETDSNKTIEVLEKALKEKVFSNLGKDDETNRQN